MRTSVQNLSKNIGRIDESNEENKKLVKPVIMTDYANKKLYGQSEYDMTQVVTRKTWRERFFFQFDWSDFKL